MLQEFVNHSSDPPQAIKREEVGEDRLHCSFPTRNLQERILRSYAHIPIQYHFCPIHTSPYLLSPEVLLDLRRDHVGFPTYSRDTTSLRFEGAPSGGNTAIVRPPPTFLALRPMRCSVEHLMKGLGLREAHDLSSS